MKIKRHLFLCSLFGVLALVMVSSVSANTSDGMTPAVENVCDELIGDAAWGLCNAYCEAMDCDSDDPQASQNACDAVSRRFEEVADGLPPCADRPTWTCECVGLSPTFPFCGNGGVGGNFGDTFTDLPLDGEDPLNARFFVCGNDPDLDHGWVCTSTAGEVIDDAWSTQENCAAM